MRRSHFPITCTFLLVLSIAGGAFSIAYGRRDFLGDFNLKYGTEGTPLDSCITCHLSSNPDLNRGLNPYGDDFYNNRTGPSSEAFNTIEPRDSDNDGFSNITEINARTFPGDPDDVPGGDGGCFVATVRVYGVTHAKASLMIFLSSMIAIAVILAITFALTSRCEHLYRKRIRKTDCHKNPLDKLTDYRMRVHWCMRCILGIFPPT